MLDLKALLTKLLGCAYTSGTDNGWRYRKYADGTYEAWRFYQATGLNLSVSSAGTYYGSGANGYRDITAPSFTKTYELVMAQDMASQSSGTYIYNIAATNGNSFIRVSYRNYASNTNASCGGDFYIRGTWK